MRSLKIVNGDLSFDNVGKLEWVDDDDNSLILQSINLKLNTDVEDLFYSETGYGRATLQGKITQDTLEDYLNDAIVDDKIANVTVNSFEVLKNGKCNLKISIELTSGEILEIEEDIEIEV